MACVHCRSGRWASIKLAWAIQKLRASLARRKEGAMRDVLSAFNLLGTCKKPLRALRALRA
jgi:hypothetical protein